MKTVFLLVALIISFPAVPAHTATPQLAHETCVTEFHIDGAWAERVCYPNGMPA